MYFEPLFAGCCRGPLTEQGVSGYPTYDEQVGDPGAPEGHEAPFDQGVDHGQLIGCGQISYGKGQASACCRLVKITLALQPGKKGSFKSTETEIQGVLPGKRPGKFES